MKICSVYQHYWAERSILTTYRLTASHSCMASNVFILCHRISSLKTIRGSENTNPRSAETKTSERLSGKDQEKTQAVAGLRTSPGSRRRKTGKRTTASRVKTPRRKRKKRRWRRRRKLRRKRLKLRRISVRVSWVLYDSVRAGRYHQHIESRYMTSSYWHRSMVQNPRLFRKKKPQFLVTVKWLMWRVTPPTRLY